MITTKKQRSTRDDLCPAVMACRRIVRGSWVVYGVLGAAMAVAAVVPAHADVINGASSAFGVESSESATVDGTTDALTDISGTATLNVGPIPTVSGDAPLVYDESTSLAAGDADTTASADLDILGSSVDFALSTGVMELYASSDVDGGSGSRMAAADATVNNLLNTASTTLATSLLDFATTTLFEVGSTQVNSEASVTGDFGSLAAIGSTTLTGSTFSLLGEGGDLLVLDLNALAGSEPAPNTEFLFTSAGATLNGSDLEIGATALLDGQIRLVLNEQVLGGDGIGFASIEVNAIRLSFESAVFGAAAINGFASGSITMNGDLLVSHSQAEISAVPEPSSSVTMLLGIIVVGFIHLYRRRRQGAN